MEWVIGDVHGCFVELLTLLQTIRFRPHAGDKAWFVGDLVDRGPASKEVVDFVRQGQAQGYFDLVRGNHEDLWIRAMEDDEGRLHRLRYPETAQSFGSLEALCEFAEWAKTLPLWLETDTALLVHAGMRPGVSMEEQKAEDLLWLRTFSTVETEARHGKRILHGHSPAPVPLVLEDRINLDTGCCYGGHLTALSLDALAKGDVVWQWVPAWRRQGAS